MSLDTSRITGQDLIQSYNIFIDTDKANLVGDKNQKGDEYDIKFANHTPRANDGEFLRLSLVDFCMYNNVYDLNQNNRVFEMQAFADTGTHLAEVIQIPLPSYINNLNNLAEYFGVVAAAHINTAAKATTGTEVTNTTFVINSPTFFDTAGNAAEPLPRLTDFKKDGTGEFGNTSNRLLDITFTTRNNAETAKPHQLNNVVFRFDEVDGECYKLLGGQRRDDTTDTTFNSLSVTIAANTVNVRGFFPMQRNTEPYVYLRVNTPNTNLESSVLTNDVGGTNDTNYEQFVRNSDILAKIPCSRLSSPDHEEYIRYIATERLDYFVGLTQRTLPTLKLRLTDSKNRPLGRKKAVRGGTASGLRNTADDGFVNNLQSTLGNLSFQATIRLDVVKGRMPGELQSMPPPNPQPARIAQAPVVWKNAGVPNTLPVMPSNFY
jgi:hypothetical protein